MARQLVCPVNPTHGKILDMAGERWGFYCSHADHDGRPVTSPFGSLAPSRAFFTTHEVEAGAPPPPPAARRCGEVPALRGGRALRDGNAPLLSGRGVSH